ncbi:MAG: alanyl-tRNA editing protein AlaXM [Candidatus Methanomethylicia archaeon]|nr:alanyl-tRNA editing protein AlaXM [Candidatus Methanomethylicia archaeon]
MKTKHLYQYDSYQRIFKAHVIAVNGREIVLDQTLFHPETGGVAHDTGKLKIMGSEYEVQYVKLDQQTESIIHVLNNEPKIEIEIEIEGEINWERRYKLMRLHTAAHLLSAIMYRDFNALITGGNVDVDEAKMDFNIPVMSREVFEDAIRKVNEIVKRALPVKIYFLKREEALKIPGIVKLAEKMPPKIEELRIVEIEGLDIQADGGPHVKNTIEVGEVKLLKVQNKGRDKRRIYFNVE